MPEFTATIVERPAIRAAGIKVSTAMEKASVDCVKIWEDFMPFMAGFPADPARAGESYGVCVMTSETAFDYWAVMPLAPGAGVPAGLAEIALPGGFYGECPVKSLEELTHAYTYMYMTWGPALTDYAMDFQRAGYELYGADFQKNGSLTVYCPLVEK